MVWKTLPAQFKIAVDKAQRQQKDAHNSLQEALTDLIGLSLQGPSRRTGASAGPTSARCTHSSTT